ncbi:hypothetical protein [Sulfolobus spindle-shaped virus]|nr:hypothetical protein [Sulfolobus spindle-shaped virus]AZG03180.1 hypothetical protein [Sulfolobus spindle-shaped virus]AZG03526.1 hypothetical protein [Sulfolobus spindle-shaped virus]
MKMKQNNATLILASEIYKAYKEGSFLNVIIFGKQGAGKTTYALRVAKEVLKMIDKNLDEQTAWEKALSYLAFNVREALQKLAIIVELHKQGHIDSRLPLLIMDDASIDLIKYNWYDKENQEFFKLNVLARTWVSAIIYTSPMMSDISKFLREKGWMVVKITRNGGYKDTESVAKLYGRVIKLNKQHTDFVGRYKPIAIDRFTRRMPDRIYEEYMRKRNRVMVSIAERLLQSEENSLV